MKEVPNKRLGMTELIKTVREVIGDRKKCSGKVGKIHYSTIAKGVWMLNGIRNCRKVNSKKIIKIYEIKRRRNVLLCLKEK